MKWTADTPRPSDPMPRGIYSPRTLAAGELVLASSVMSVLRLSALIVF